MEQIQIKRELISIHGCSRELLEADTQFMDRIASAQRWEEYKDLYCPELEIYEIKTELKFKYQDGGRR